MQAMTGKKNPVIINGRAPDNFIIEYDGESASVSSYHKKPNVIMPPIPDDEPEFIIGRQNSKSTAAINDLIERMKQKRLDAIMKDEKKSWREEAQLCKVCTYTAWFGGQVFTTTTCTKCGKEMTFPSTVVDTYCIDCAKELGVCKMCGKPMD